MTGVSPVLQNAVVPLPFGKHPFFLLQDDRTRAAVVKDSRICKFQCFARTQSLSFLPDLVSLAVLMTDLAVAGSRRAVSPARAAGTLRAPLLLIAGPWGLGSVGGSRPRSVVATH